MTFVISKYANVLICISFVDIFEPSKGAGFIDIQDGDAISESSDTEIVAHTKEQIQYDNPATSSESNSDNDVNESPPPLNSDEDDDEGSDVDGIDGPPPLDSDDNAEGTDNGEELTTSPDTGSREELDTKRPPVYSERRHVKSSEDSESDSDSEREVPPPLDSEDDEEDNNLSSPTAENAESANVDTVESYTHDSPVEEVNNDDDDNDDNDNDNDDEQPDGNNDDDNDDDEHHDGNNDDDDDDEYHDVNNDDDDEYHDVNDDDDDDSGDNDKEDEEEDDAEAVPQSTEPVTPENENSDQGEPSDSPVEAERHIPLQNQSDDSDDGVVDDKESDHEAALDSVEKVHVASVDDVGSSLVPDMESHEDEKEDSADAGVTEDTGATEDAVGSELDVKGVICSDHDHNVPVNFRKEEARDDDSDHDSDESPEFVPIDDDNELEWDIEDFDVPQHKTVNRPSKMNTEEEVDKLKKTFLDTLKSEAEQSTVVKTEQKAESKKKVDKGLGAKNILKDEKKHARDNSKNVETKDLKNESGKYSRKVTKDTPSKTEQVKVEKKIVKDRVKDISKPLASSKPVDNTTKPTKAKVKATDKGEEQTNKLKTEKQRKDIKGSQKVTEASVVERKPVSKAGNVKSASVSSLPTGADVQQRSHQTLPTKEKKKARPVSDIRADSRSHKQKDEVTLTANQQRKEVKKPRKSDSDASSGSLTRQKPQKTTSSESVTSKLKKSSPAVTTTHKEKERAADTTEVRKTKSKRTVSKPVADGSDHEDVVNRERKRRSDVPVKNPAEVKAKPKGRPTSNGHLSSSQEKLSLHSGHHDHSPRDHGSRGHLARDHVARDHGAKDHSARDHVAKDHSARDHVAKEHSASRDRVSRDHGTHKHSSHAHDRSKHVWLCRDDEIHKLIAQKASLLKEYESGSLAGRKVCK